MSKIIGVTVGTPMNPQKLKEELTSQKIKSALGYTPANEATVNELSEAIADLDISKVEQSDLETEVENQLDGAKADIVTELIRQIGGLPVFGTVDDNKVITLKSTLSSGEYTMVYEKDDGTISPIITFTFVDDEPTYINLVPTSIDTDGSVFNGTGYKNDTYISSSSGAASSTTGFVTTGFMELGLEFYIKGAEYTSNTYNRVAFYDEAFGKKEVLAGTNASGMTVTDMGNGVTKITISPNIASTSGYKYIRLSLKGTGENLIVSATPIE